MSLNKWFRTALILLSLFLLAGCENESGNIGSAADIHADKYGCVMYDRIETDTDDAMAIKILGPDGACVMFVPYDISSNEEIAIAGEIITGDGIHNENGFLFDQNECAVFEGKTIGKTAIPEGYSIVWGESEVYRDVSECIHVANAFRLEEGRAIKSYIVLKDGNVVFKRDFLDEKDYCKLIYLPDSSVAADIIVNRGSNGFSHEIIQYNSNTSACETICEFNTAEVLKDDEIVALNIYDEKHLVYLTCNGVYLSDYNMDNSEMIFAWHKNGLSFSSVVSSFEDYRICANKQGDIFLLKDSFRCSEYLKLSVVPDDITIIEIAGIEGIRSYSKAVFDFNVNHPEYKIVIVSDFDKTNMLTKIIAGDGPEIIEAGIVDTSLQKKYWMPLEKLVSKDIIDNLNKGAVICGSIEGELFGATSGFSIDTLVTGEDFYDWDYDLFLQTIDNSRNLKTITSNGLLEGKLPVLEYLFCDGTDDTYFINEDANNGIINKDRLKKVIALIEKYQAPGNYDLESFDMVADKSMLCARFLVSRPADVYNISYAFGNKGNIIGYPGKNGSKHYIIDSGTLFVRNNISEEKRKIISEFFEYLLSYEGQKKTLFGNVIDGFSARNDVLDEQVEALKDREGERVGLGGVMFTYENIDVTYVKEQLEKIIEKSIPKRNFDYPFYSILSEEIGNYFAGSIDIDTLEDRLNKRIRIYIDERQ